MYTSYKSTISSILIAAAVVTGCTNNATNTADTATKTGGTTGTPTTGTPTTGTPTTGEPSTGTATTGTATTGELPTTSSTTEMATETSAQGYAFREDDRGDYNQVDRAGLPGLSTMLIPSDRRDVYNSSAPVDDVSGDFFADIVASLTLFNERLADDILTVTAASGALDPDGDPAEVCAITDDGTVLDNAANTCMQQIGQFLVPDRLTIFAPAGPGFPNGRDLVRPVMDIAFAVETLEFGERLGIPGVPPPPGLGAPPPPLRLAFTDLGETPGGLMQAPNDVELPTGFPYLAPAQ